MMSSIFLLQLLLTFAIGSVWIYFTTIASTRWGSKTGGFIGGLPSTALLSFFFIGLSQSPEVASAAANTFPLAYGITGLFLVAYALLANRGFSFALTISLLIWFILSAGIAYLNPTDFLSILLTYLAILIFAYYILEIKLRVISHEKSMVNYSRRQTALRSVFGGLIIVVAVSSSKIGGPVFGAIFSAFPAMFISILAISYKTYGKDFSRAMTKPLMVTGMITIVVYAITVKYAYIEMGLYIGTIIAIITSGISAYLIQILILRKMV